jgi:hypothetical protein
MWFLNRCFRSPPTVALRVVMNVNDVRRQRIRSETFQFDDLPCNAWMPSPFSWTAFRTSVI